MSNPPDVQRNLDHCVAHIRAASEVMPGDMRDAAMKLGAAAMMLASASHAVYRHAVQLTEGQTPLDTGEQPDAEGS